jgi:hypothetical protein
VAQVLLDVVPRQERERQLLAFAVRLQLPLDLQERMLPAQHVRAAIGHHEQGGDRLEPAGDVGEQVDGRQVRPLQVVEEDHERLPARDVLQERRELPLQELL